MHFEELCLSYTLKSRLLYAWKTKEIQYSYSPHEPFNHLFFIGTIQSLDLSKFLYKRPAPMTKLNEDINLSAKPSIKHV